MIKRRTYFTSTHGCFRTNTFTHKFDVVLFYAIYQIKMR